jgi:hypothetical protein
MHEAAVRMKNDFICLEVDLQKAHSPADAIVALSVQTRSHLPLWHKTKKVFGELAWCCTGPLGRLTSERA